MVIVRPVLPHIDAPKPIGAPKPNAPPALSPAPYIAPVAPKPVARVTSPDLTGLYEHVPVKGKNSAVLLQLNQAGRVLVGWFTGPPAFVTNLSPTVSRTGKYNETRMPPGVLMAFLSDISPATQTVQFSWKETPRWAQPDPANPLSMHLLDPTDIASDKDKVGLLRLIEGPFPDVGRDIALAFEFSADFRRSDLSAYDLFRRVSITARLSNYILSTLPAEMQLKLLTEQVCPVPTSYVDELRVRLAASSDQLPSIAGLIAIWRRASARAARKIAREKIGDEVERILQPETTPVYYREAVYTHVRAQSSWKDLTIDGDRRTYIEWYRMVAAEALDELRATQIADARTSPNFDDVPLLKTFRMVGLEPDGDYRYTLSFVTLSYDDAIKALKLIKFVPQGFQLLPEWWKEVERIMKVKGGIFMLNIKKEMVTVDKDSSGRLKLKDGDPIILNRKTVWDTAAGQTVARPMSFVEDGFVGLFGEIGAGLSVAVRSAKTGGGGSLKDVSFMSTLDLESDDFAFAFYTGTLLGGPNIKLGDFASFDSFTSRFAQVSLNASRGGFVLWTSETKTMKLKLLELSDLKPKLAEDLKKMAEEYYKKWTEPQAEGRVLELATSGAWIYPLFTPKPKTPHYAAPKSMIHDREILRSGNLVIEAFYNVNSSDLDAMPRGVTFSSANFSRLGLPPRDILEIYLATDRAFFMSPDNSMEVEGCTSPEQPAAANLALSQQRVDAVIQAIKDAFGAELKITRITRTPLGEQPAIDSGLKDPESLSMPREQFQKAFPDQVAKWPYWRRTDIIVDGRLVARVQAAQ